MSHLDASKESSIPHFLSMNGGRKYCWAITSPPYSNQDTYLGILDVMFKISEFGVIAKLGTCFLHPTPGRVEWLRNHPPSSVIFLRDHPSISGHASARRGEIWVIWLHDEELNEDGTFKDFENLKKFNFGM